MIPKIIHYCWLSDDPIPESLQTYMRSWQNILHDYTFVLWNFSRFDISSSVWVKQAFENKKYAFAADYIRLYALYNYGGIYLDMDVEVLKRFDDLLPLRSMISWEKDSNGLEMATIGSEKGAKWVGSILDYYKDREFVTKHGFDTKTLPRIAVDVLREKGFQIKSVSEPLRATAIVDSDTLHVLPSDYFSPKSYKTGRLHVNENTYSIHHFAGSWIVPKWYEIIEMRFWKLLKIRNLNLCNKIKYLPKNIYLYYKRIK